MKHTLGRRTKKANTREMPESQQNIVAECVNSTHIRNTATGGDSTAGGKKAAGNGYKDNTSGFIYSVEEKKESPLSGLTFGERRKKHQSCDPK